jgi:hypothetical protein
MKEHQTQPNTDIGSPENKSTQHKSPLPITTEHMREREKHTKQKGGKKWVPDHGFHISSAAASTGQ